MTKSYKFFRFYKRFYKEREKTLVQQSTGIEKFGLWREKIDFVF